MPPPSLQRGSTMSWQSARTGVRNLPQLTVEELFVNEGIDVVHFVKHHGVRLLGEFEISDLKILKCFKESGVLTFGSESADIDWQHEWRARLQFPESRASNQSGAVQEAVQAFRQPPAIRQRDWRRVRELVEDGMVTPLLARNDWVHQVKLQAYVVSLRGAAGRCERGLVHPLLKRWHGGACHSDVFALPAVKSVLAYKWSSFAGKLLLWELAFYFVWLSGFSLVMLFADFAPRAAQRSPGNWADARAASASAGVVLGLAGMMPFIAIEVAAVHAYQWGWLGLWNCVDLSTYALQVGITVLYLHNSPFLAVAVALQCILLWVRLQYFSRAFRTLSFDFVGSLQAVLVEVRWYLLVMLLLMWGFACSFYTLFRKDNADPEDVGRRAEQFATLPLSVLTMFSYAVGGATYYMSTMTNSSFSVTATALCILYQFVVSMVLMSMLVGVMTNAITKATANDHLKFLVSRAEIIDELEAVMPAWLGPPPPAYVHVLRPDPDSYAKGSGLRWDTAAAGDDSAAAAGQGQADATATALAATCASVAQLEGRVDALQRQVAEALLLLRQLAAEGREREEAAAVQAAAAAAFSPGVRDREEHMHKVL